MESEEQVDESYDHSPVQPPRRNFDYLAAYFAGTLNDSQRSRIEMHLNNFETELRRVISSRTLNERTLDENDLSPREVQNLFSINEINNLITHSYSLNSIRQYNFWRHRQIEANYEQILQETELRRNLAQWSSTDHVVPRDTGEIICDSTFATRGPNVPIRNTSGIPSMSLTRIPQMHQFFSANPNIDYNRIMSFNAFRNIQHRGTREAISTEGLRENGRNQNEMANQEISTVEPVQRNPEARGNIRNYIGFESSLNNTNANSTIGCQKEMPKRIKEQNMEDSQNLQGRKRMYAYKGEFILDSCHKIQKLEKSTSVREEPVPTAQVIQCPNTANSLTLKQNRPDGVEWDKHFQYSREEEIQFPSASIQNCNKEKSASSEDQNISNPNPANSQMKSNSTCISSFHPNNIILDNKSMDPNTEKEYTFCLDRPRYLQYIRMPAPPRAANPNLALYDHCKYLLSNLSTLMPSLLPKPVESEKQRSLHFDEDLKLMPSVNAEKDKIKHLEIINERWRKKREKIMQEKSLKFSSTTKFYEKRKISSLSSVDRSRNSNNNFCATSVNFSIPSSKKNNISFSANSIVNPEQRPNTFSPEGSLLQSNENRLGENLLVTNSNVSQEIDEEKSPLSSNVTAFDLTKKIASNEQINDNRVSAIHGSEIQSGSSTARIQSNTRSNPLQRFNDSRNFNSNVVGSASYFNFPNYASENTSVQFPAHSSSASCWISKPGEAVNSINQENVSNLQKNNQHFSHIGENSQRDTREKSVLNRLQPGFVNLQKQNEDLNLTETCSGKNIDKYEIASESPKSNTEASSAQFSLINESNDHTYTKFEFAETTEDIKMAGIKQDVQNKNYAPASLSSNCKNMTSSNIKPNSIKASFGESSEICENRYMNCDENNSEVVLDCTKDSDESDKENILHDISSQN